MPGPLRFLIGMALAAIVTAGLFVLMITLIAGEFTAQEKEENASFEINPTVEDIETIERTAVVERVQRVETPPPPSLIERQQSTKPTERIASLEGAVPEFEAPKIDASSFEIVVSDRDAQPLVRIPPIMPPRAEKSGHCKVRFDVSPTGQPFNVDTTYCSSSVFKSASVKSVEKWKYQPKIQDGIAVGRRGVESKITFQLADERGNLIPE